MPLITKKSELEPLIAEARKSGFMAFDTETTGLNWPTCVIKGASFCFDGQTGYYIKPDLMVPFSKAMGDANLPKAAHNTKFDLHFLRKSGVKIDGLCYDTETMLRLLDENRYERGLNYKLKDVCAELFGVDASEEQKALKEYRATHGLAEDNFTDIPDEIMVPYACKDAVLVHRLFKYLLGQIEAKDASAGGDDRLMTLRSMMEREAKVTLAVCRMEENGHLVDTAFLDNYKNVLALQQEEARKKVLAMAGEEFSPASDDEVRVQMLKLGWLPKEKTATGKAKADKYALEDWEHPFAEAMLEYRRCGKLISTYCEGMIAKAIKTHPQDTIGVLHPDFRTNGAVTGRFSCASPNLQNTDKKSEARQAFVVRPGHTNFYLDFKQIEVCGFAYYANDKIMQDALWTGDDFHMINAVAIFDKPADQITKDERDKAKTFNFALMYGAGEKKIAKQLHVPVETAGLFKKRYMSKFPSVPRLRYRCETAIRQKGYITNRFGRRRNLKPEDCYKAMNALIQSWAADLLKESLVRVDAALEGHNARILLQIHDELILEIKDGPGQAEALDTALKAMTSVGELVDTVPIRVDVKWSSTNWHQRKELTDADLSSMRSGGVLGRLEVLPDVRLTASK